MEDKADSVVVKQMTVEYKGSTSRWRGSLFGSVDNGIFYLACKNDTWLLNYQINMRKLFIGTAVLSSIMGFYALANGGPWWIGIIEFLWLCGANWVIIFLRHGGVATAIAAGIDELTYGKMELPEQDKMTGELKSWF